MPFIVLTVLPQPTSAMDGSNMFHAAVKQVGKECTLYIYVHYINIMAYILYLFFHHSKYIYIHTCTFTYIISIYIYIMYFYICICITFHLSSIICTIYILYVYYIFMYVYIYICVLYKKISYVEYDMRFRCHKFMFMLQILHNTILYRIHTY